VTRRGRGAGYGTGDGGQSTVELALALPLVTLLLLLVVQVGLVIRDQLLVSSAAREGARAAPVVAPSDHAAVERAAARAGPLDPTRLEVLLDPDGHVDDTVEVRVRYRSHTDLPLVGPLVPDVDLSAMAVMQRE